MVVPWVLTVYGEEAIIPGLAALETDPGLYLRQEAYLEVLEALGSLRHDEHFVRVRPAVDHWVVQGPGVSIAASVELVVGNSIRRKAMRWLW